MKYPGLTGATCVCVEQWKARLETQVADIVQIFSFTAKLKKLGLVCQATRKMCRPLSREGLDWIKIHSIGIGVTRFLWQLLTKHSGQCFPNFNVPENHPGHSLKCRCGFSSCEMEPVILCLSQGVCCCLLLNGNSKASLGPYKMHFVTSHYFQPVSHPGTFSLFCIFNCKLTFLLPASPPVPPFLTL